MEAYVPSVGAKEKGELYASDPEPAAHPFTKIGSCTCGYHKRCPDAADHCLEVIKLRDEGYDGRCKAAWGQVKKKGAVDHIIELWEVRAAYFRAVCLFEEFNSVMDCATSAGFPKDQISGLKWPKNKKEELVVLYNLRFFFNSEENLCLIDSDFNLAKNKFLDRGEDPGPSDIRRQMQAYYIATANFREAVLDMLTDEFDQTKQLIYWLVRNFLLANGEHFAAECKKYESEPMGDEDVRPIGVFLPRSVVNPSERYRVVEKAVDQLMDMMTEKEWEELEKNDGKAQKTIKTNKKAPPKKKTINEAVARILDDSDKIASKVAKMAGLK